MFFLSLLYLSTIVFCKVICCFTYLLVQRASRYGYEYMVICE